jgi:hypothetical protein
MSSLAEQGQELLLLCLRQARPMLPERLAAHRIGIEKFTNKADRTATF